MTVTYKQFIKIKMYNATHTNKCQMSKTLIGGAVGREFKSEVKAAEDVLDSVIVEDVPYQENEQCEYQYNGSHRQTKTKVFLELFYKLHQTTHRANELLSDYIGYQSINQSRFLRSQLSVITGTVQVT